MDNPSIEASAGDKAARSHITTIGPHDVLLGRGNNKNEGNLRFLALVQKAKPEYLKAHRHVEKHDIAKKIFNTIVGYQGRFLRQVEPEERHQRDYTRTWISVDAEKAIEKVKQALRDYGQKSRAEKPVLPNVPSKRQHRQQGMSLQEMGFASRTEMSAEALQHQAEERSLAFRTGAELSQNLQTSQQIDQQQLLAAYLQIQNQQTQSPVSNPLFSGQQPGQALLQALLLQQNPDNSTSLTSRIANQALLLHQQQQQKNDLATIPHTLAIQALLLRQQQQLQSNSDHASTLLNQALIVQQRQADLTSASNPPAPHPPSQQDTLTTLLQEKVKELQQQQLVNALTSHQESNRQVLSTGSAGTADALNAGQAAVLASSLLAPSASAVAQSSLQAGMLSQLFALSAMSQSVAQGSTTTGIALSPGAVLSNANSGGLNVDSTGSEEAKKVEPKNDYAG